MVNFTAWQKLELIKTVIENQDSDEDYGDIVDKIRIILELNK